MKLKSMVVAIGGIGIIGASSMYVKSGNLEKNFLPVEAEITKAEVDCFIKTGNVKLENKETGELSYFDCRIAPYVAVKFEFDENDVQQRLTATYRYTSPLNGKRYDGNFTRTGSQISEKFPVGKKVPVFASKSAPEKSVTSSGNFFVDDKFQI